MLTFRIIGRISFPIFAWMIANGAMYTKNIKMYLVRLFVLACISQPLFYLVNSTIDPLFNGLNVFFTLFVGLCTIIFLRKIKNKFLWPIIILLGAIVSNVTRSEYGGVGVWSIVFFYIFNNKKFYMIASQVFTYAVSYWLWFPLQPNQLYAYLLLFIIQLLGLFSLILITLYNGKEGYKVKYFFYLIYPIQYIFIYILQKQFLGS